MITLERAFLDKDLILEIEKYAKKNNFSLSPDGTGSLYQIPTELITGRIQQSYTLFDEDLCRYRILNFVLNKDVGDGSFEEIYNRDSIILRQNDKKLIFHNQYHQIVVSGIDLDNEPSMISSNQKSLYDPKDPLASFLYLCMINNNNLNIV